MSAAYSYVTERLTHRSFPRTPTANLTDMTRRRLQAVVASSHPIEAYGGIQLPPHAMDEIAQRITSGEMPMLFAHDLGRPAHARNARAWTEPTGDGFVRVVAEFDVDAEAWAKFERELAEAGVEGLGGMSISFMGPLEGEPLPEGHTILAADAHHFTDDEIALAVAKLRQLDPEAGGERLYQLSVIPPLKVVVDLVLDGALAIGLSVVAAGIYDALRGLIRPGRRNEINVTFRQSPRGKRVVNISIPVTSAEQLEVALRGLPDVVREGAHGTFVYQDERYELVGLGELLDATEVPEVEEAASEQEPAELDERD